MKEIIEEALSEFSDLEISFFLRDQQYGTQNYEIFYSKQSKEILTEIFKYPEAMEVYLMNEANGIVINIPNILTNAASSADEEYPIHFNIIEIDKEPEKNDQFKLEIIQKSKTKITIRFWSKNPGTNRKFTLFLKIKEQEIELASFENIDSEEWEPEDFENDIVANIPWHSVNVDDFHKLYLRVAR